MARKTKDTTYDVPADPDDWEDGPEADEATHEDAPSPEPPPAEPSEDESETISIPVAEGVEPFEVGAVLGRQILADLGSRVVVVHRIAPNGKQVVVTSDPCRKYEYLIPHLGDLF